ncbi:MAG: DUF1566 domain-containing protein [Anaerolineales bacterium]|jgi:hypothetical protein
MQKKHTPIFHEFSAMWGYLLKALPLVVVLMAGTAAAVLAAAGTTDSPSGPTTAGSQMYTLDQIYDLLDTGITSPKMTTFTEPLVSPGTGSMVTLDDLMAEALATRCNCASGTLYGTRWCINGDGTVTDLTTCLVWLQDANCLDVFGNVDKSSGTLTWDDAMAWTGVLRNSYCNLSDGSRREDWEVPTAPQLVALTDNSKPEYVQAGSPGPFINVQNANYWTSSTYVAYDFHHAIYVRLGNGTSGVEAYDDGLLEYYYVWPVRDWD